MPRRLAECVVESTVGDHESDFDDMIVVCDHHPTSRDTHLLGAGCEIVWRERRRFALL